MDIGIIAPLTHTLAIKHPGTGRPTGLTITLKSTDDPEVKAVIRKITDRRLKLAARGKNFTVDEVEGNNVSLLLRAIESWEWGVDADGKQSSFNGDQLDFNPLNGAKVLNVDWLRDQVDECLGDTARFFQS